jgi:photosystem II stability/assembly factor-like uncharacterized protein
MAISLSHGGGDTIYTADSLSDEVLVGTTNGIDFIKRSSAGWSVTGHVLEGKHVHALLFEPGSGLWFAGIRKGGVMVSEDGGKTWESRDVGITVRNIYSLSQATINGKKRLFCGTEPSALFISDDLGLTWAEISALKDVPSHETWTFPGPPHESHLKHISFAHDDPTKMYGSIEQGALLKSLDGGATWQDFTNMYVDVHRCIVDPRDSEHIYVTGGQGLWISRNGGADWDNRFNRGSEEGGYPDQLVYKPSDPDYIVLSAGRKSPPAWKEGSAETRISRSRDGGVKWEILGGGLEDRFTYSVEAMCLEEAGDNCQILAATTGGDVLFSPDAGEHWETVVTGLAPVSKGSHFENFAGLAK